MNTINLATTTDTTAHIYNETQDSFYADANAGDVIITVIVDAHLSTQDVDALLDAHLFADDVDTGIVTTSGGLLTYYGPATDAELSRGVSIPAGNLFSVSSS